MPGWCNIKWTEAAFERGAAAGRSSWTAILTIVTRAPANAEVLRSNPLGIYVDAIDWSRELDVPVPPAPPAAPHAGLPAGAPADSGLASDPAPLSQEMQP